MSIQTFKRREKKFLIDQKQFEEIGFRIANHMELDRHCPDGAEYKIYNLYFDTDTDELIRSSISKPYYKEKLRLRSYSEIDSPGQEVFLEIKKKIGGIVSKRRAALKLHEARNFLISNMKPQSSSYISSQVNDEISAFLRNYKVSPKVFVGYERIAYFAREDKDLRMTFDKNIVTRRDNLSLRNDQLDGRLIPEDKYLMELKFSDSSPLWVAKMLSELEIYSTSFSKYGNEFKKHCLKNKKNKIFKYGR